MNFKIKGDKVIMLIVILLGMVSILSVFSAGSYLVRNADGGMSKVAIYWEQARSV
ncbi:MAG: hypothetical protein HUJ90_03460, partial [Bacteroidales bacterium]|nr:hypothetical protein [Bacteroidales bacterium]